MDLLQEFPSVQKTDVFFQVPLFGGDEFVREVCENLWKKWRCASRTQRCGQVMKEHASQLSKGTVNLYQPWLPATMKGARKTRFAYANFQAHNHFKNINADGSF